MNTDLRLDQIDVRSLNMEQAKELQRVISDVNWVEVAPEDTAAIASQLTTLGQAFLEEHVDRSAMKEGERPNPFLLRGETFHTYFEGVDHARNVFRRNIDLSTFTGSEARQHLVELMRAGFGLDVAALQLVGQIGARARYLDAEIEQANIQKTDPARYAEIMKWFVSGGGKSPIPEIPQVPAEVIDAMADIQRGSELNEEQKEELRKAIARVELLPALMDLIKKEFTLMRTSLATRTSSALFDRHIQKERGILRVSSFETRGYFDSLNSLREILEERCPILGRLLKGADINIALFFWGTDSFWETVERTNRGNVEMLPDEQLMKKLQEIPTATLLKALMS